MLTKEWLRAFAPVGRLQADKEWAAFGACVFFHQPPILWLVTANHVLTKVGQQALSVLVGQEAGNIVVVEAGKILAQHGLAWVQDESSDLAAAPIPPVPGLKAVTAENCLRACDLVPSMPCFTVGCPYGLAGLDPQAAIPLVLDGVIAGLSPANGRVFTSAPTFPGNSGGPLLAVRSPFSPAGALTAGIPTVFLAGIMLATHLVHDPDPTRRNPPLHLGVAATADALLTLLNSESARDVAASVAALSPRVS